MQVLVGAAVAGTRLLLLGGGDAVRPERRPWDNPTMAGGRVLRIAERGLGADRCELRLEGELDLWSVERLQAVPARVARDNDAVLVGLEPCEFIDSTGISLFLQVRRQLAMVE